MINLLHLLWIIPISTFIGMLIAALLEANHSSVSIPNRGNLHAEERILNAGYEDVVYLTNYSYDNALIGISEDNRAVYDYNKMVEWLMNEESFSEMDAIEWIDYNTIRALLYMGDKAPIIMYPIE